VATPFVPTKHNIASVDVGILQETIQGAAENLLPSSVNDQQWFCGKKCKGRRGLKAHQRSFHTFKTLVISIPLPQDECLAESQEQAPLDLIELQSASSPTDKCVAAVVIASFRREIRIKITKDKGTLG